MNLNKNTINKLAEDFSNKYCCSNYEHNNPTTEEVKSFILDIILELNKKSTDI